MRKRWLICLLSLILASCATTEPSQEKPIKDGATVATGIVVCKTTYMEIEQRLGSPSRDGLLGQDRVVTWIVEWKPLVRYLGVMVDKQNLIVDRYWNLPSEVAWTPTNRCR
ncbi:MAG: hypothetical protein ACXVKD_15735 [Candidatus Angelobacter sp.]